VNRDAQDETQNH